MTHTISLTLEETFALAQSSLEERGFSTSQAEAIAESVTIAERDGCSSHGLFRIPFYLNALKNPGCDPKAEPELTVSDSSVVHVDARGGFCPLAVKKGVPELVQKANSQGIAALAVHNCYNIAALWPDVEALAENGLVAFAFTAANAFVAPAGGIKPIYGTNPMAFAWPRPGQPPLVFDQASSASARGEIQLHLRDGKNIPEGWAIDSEGTPTTDPEAALAGAQLTFGGYKGAAIALMIELLAGALIGDLFSYESSERDAHRVGAPFGGEFLLAIDPSHCVPDGNIKAQQARAELLFEKILEQEGTRLPGARRQAARMETKVNGISIPETLHSAILQAGRTT
ncbi:MAG: Ldh family oxidoreductase [Acidiferrobacterales bacterium]|nr:Ldh family oxidoreductase [Acidiferrobacterales bacterium]